MDGFRTLTSPAVVAKQLAADEIHVWCLPYTRHCGRAPFKRLLGAYLARGADDVRLRDGDHGRPQLTFANGQAPDARLDFNWSHSGTAALLAVARGIRPGIDLEAVRPRARSMELARRYFGAEEVAMLEQRDPAMREHAFLRLWTAKEAVLKAHGRGLAFGLDRLAIDVDPLRLLRMEGEAPGDWQLRRLDAGPQHVAALAWRGMPRRVRLFALADAHAKAHCDPPAAAAVPDDHTR